MYTFIKDNGMTIHFTSSYLTMYVCNVCDAILYALLKILV